MFVKIFLLYVAFSLAPALVNTADEPVEKIISAADRARIAELLRTATAELHEARGSLITRTAADIAILQTKIGEDAAAVQNFAWAKQLIGPDTMEYRELARASARAGDVTSVLRLTKDLPQSLSNWTRPDFRDTVLSECANELARLRRMKDAREILDQIENTDRQKSATARAERTFVQELARNRSASEALKESGAVKDPVERVRMLAGTLFRNFTFMDYPQEPGIALRQAKAGDRTGAEKSLEKAHSVFPELSKDRLGWAAATLSGAYSQMGELDQAEQFLRQSKDPVWLPFAQAAYLKALAQAGKTIEADAILAKLDKGDLVHALYHFGVGQFRAGDRAGAKASFARAHHVLSGLPNQNIHLHNLISAQALGGDAAGALAALGGDAQREAVGISNIVYSLARNGEYVEAHQMAERLPEGAWWRGNCLRAIAKVQAAKGKEADALAWVNKLSSPFDKGNALLGIAEGIADPAAVNER